MNLAAKSATEQENWVIVIGQQKEQEEKAALNNLRGLIHELLPRYAAAVRESKELTASVLTEVIRIVVEDKKGAFRRRRRDGTVYLEWENKETHVRKALSNRFREQLNKLNKRSPEKINQMVNEYYQRSLREDDDVEVSVARLQDEECSDVEDDSDLDSLDDCDDRKPPAVTNWKEIESGHSETNLAKKGRCIVSDGEASINGALQSSPSRSFAPQQHNSGNRGLWLWVPTPPVGFDIKGVSVVTMSCKTCDKRSEVHVSVMSRLTCSCSTGDEKMENQETTSDSDANENTFVDKDMCNEASEDENEGEDLEVREDKNRRSGPTDKVHRLFLEAMTKASEMNEDTSESGEQSDPVELFRTQNSPPELTDSSDTTPDTLLDADYPLGWASTRSHKGVDYVNSVIDDRIEQYLCSSINPLHPATGTSRINLIADVLTLLQQQGGSFKIKSSDGKWETVSDKIAACHVARLFFERSRLQQQRPGSATKLSQENQAPRAASETPFEGERAVKNGSNSKESQHTLGETNTGSAPDYRLSMLVSAAMADDTEMKQSKEIVRGKSGKSVMDDVRKRASKVDINARQKRQVKAKPLPKRQLYSAPFSKNGHLLKETKDKASSLPAATENHPKIRANANAEAGDNYIVCGRGQRLYNNTGNKTLRNLVAAYLSIYIDKNTSRSSKSRLVDKATQEMFEMGMVFVKMSKNGVGWETLTYGQARAKVAHRFRDAARRVYAGDHDDLLSVASTPLNE